uniref:hypothetical protein n=1 Tax=Enterococcus faecium TaxID=1352 RepID=UPI0021D57E43
EEAEELEITKGDIAAALMELKNRKAPPGDNIPSELLMPPGEELVEQIHQLFQAVIKSRKVPSAWKLSTTVPIFKWGARKSPENYRAEH